MLVLGLETSCDETGVALYDSERGLLADALFSQIDLHRAYGGVVPELASRDHVKRMLPLIREVLADAGAVASDIDAIAYTAGPGLVGALLVGASCAQSMAFAWDIPAIGVHHMEGHLLAPMLEEQPPQFPFVAVLVSAIGVSYSAHINRQLLNTLYGELSERDKAQAEWGRLILEQSTWTAHSRIESLATEQLKMRIPDATEIRMVSP